MHALVLRIFKTCLLTTLVAGVLDLLSAFVFAGLAGHGPLLVLRGVAAGPFGDHMMRDGLGAAFVGLCVHFLIMANVATVFVLLVAMRPSLNRYSVVLGIGYGLLVYLMMYWVVLPLRYPGVFPQHEPFKVAKALFSHFLCIGLPIAIVTRRMLSAHGRNWEA